MSGHLYFNLISRHCQVSHKKFSLSSTHSHFLVVIVFRFSKMSPNAEMQHLGDDESIFWFIKSVGCWKVKMFPKSEIGHHFQQQKAVSNKKITCLNYCMVISPPKLAGTAYVPDLLIPALLLFKESLSKFSFLNAI